MGDVLRLSRNTIFRVQAEVHRLTIENIRFRG